MCQTDVIVAPAKGRTTKLTFNRQQRYQINRVRMVLYKGAVITWEDYQEELTLNN